MTRKKLYLLLGIACVAGYIWIFMTGDYIEIDKSVFEVCLIKSLTNVPCPSCGSTRTVHAILSGNPGKVWEYNPLGILILLGLLISPIWIFVDLFTSGASLFHAYQTMEKGFADTRISIPLVVLLLINWFWNIYKEL